MDRSTIEIGERLNPVDLYWILGELARTRLKIAKDEPVWEGFCGLEDAFEALFENCFASGDEWIDCFNSVDGVVNWWNQFRQTAIYHRAKQVTDQMKSLLLQRGLDPKHLDEKSLLLTSRELDGPICDIAVSCYKAEILRRPFGWMEVRLCMLTVPGDESEEPSLVS